MQTKLCQTEKGVEGEGQEEDDVRSHAEEEEVEEGEEDQMGEEKKRRREIIETPWPGQAASRDRQRRAL